MILLYGPPGSGKSVQGQLLAARYDWRWLSTGQLLRDTFDEEVHKQMEERGVVENRAVYRVLTNALNEAQDIDNVILDGFPRDLEQARWLVAALPAHQRSINAVINLEVPLEELLRRLEIRDRFDDSEMIIRKRYHDYLGMSDEMIEFMKDQKVPIINVNGVGDPEDIHNHIVKELSNVYKNKNS